MEMSVGKNQRGGGLGLCVIEGLNVFGWRILRPIQSLKNPFQGLKPMPLRRLFVSPFNT
jgi:hypothetical protein